MEPWEGTHRRKNGHQITNRKKEKEEPKDSFFYFGRNLWKGTHFYFYPADLAIFFNLLVM